MADNTRIEWTDATWNPVTGCTKVSPGCDHCYAERVTERFHGPGSFATVVMHPDRLGMPLRWRKPRRIFVNSMSDLFHDDVPDGFIAQVWNVMAQCPQHTFQILTKRHARLRSWVSRWADRTGDSDHDKPSGMPPMPRGPEAVRAVYTSGRALLFADMLDSLGEPPEGCAYPPYDWIDGQRFWPGVLSNVWLGVSVEDQQWADIRIPALLDTPAAVRFLSCEPLLGPIRLRRLQPSRIGGPLYADALVERHDQVDGKLLVPAVDWVIVGGESGPGARPMRPQWARDIRDQCTAAGVPFLFKQWGEFAPARDDEAWQVGAEFWPIWRYGKRNAGRELDGRTWDEYPPQLRAAG